MCKYPTRQGVIGALTKLATTLGQRCSRARTHLILHTARQAQADGNVTNVARCLLPLRN
jgi:hypothetical protein